MRNSLVAVFILLSSLLSSSALAEEALSGEHLKIDWIAPDSFGSVAETIGIRFRIDKDWHVYWKNPGDSGAAPKFEIDADGAEAGDIQWPLPARIPYSHLTNIGYDDEVVYLFEVKPSSGSVKLSVKVEWLVCQKECIPGFGTLTLERPVRGDSAVWTEESRKVRDGFLKRVPALADSAASALEISLSPEALELFVKGSDIEPQVFPVDSNFLSPAAPSVTKADAGWKFRFVIPEGKNIPPATGFVIADAQGIHEYADVSTSPRIGEEGRGALGLVLVLAFLGGLILNLMPCVLPVLSIKIFSVVKSSPETRRHEGVLYAAGVLVTFTALGGLLAFLRAGGAAVGWGYQLQSPLVILALALLFFLMALNFLGFFELGDGVMNLAGRHQGGAFASGVLAVFVAAPCTGPFMGTALGAAATMSVLPSLLIFVFLGLGLASPFLAVAFFPRLAGLMPRPGAWMDRIKQFLAFPLLATVVWLLWVLGLQVGPDGWFYPVTLFLGVAFALWIGKAGSPRARVVAWLVAVVVLAVTARGIVSAEATAAGASTIADSEWKHYDSKLIAEARARKQNVFIDFTAAWCITCQVNKKVVLDTSRALELFRAHGTLLVRADWTRQDPAITKALAALGRSSVPVYAFYAADGAEVKMLPQILSMSMIEELFPSNTKEKL